ncbi:MAG: BatD family protein [Flavobacteriales bacterium]|nr:BatD family protein [Flavobacteriales bacterium]
MNPVRVLIRKWIRHKRRTPTFSAPFPSAKAKPTSASRSSPRTRSFRATTHLQADDHDLPKLSGFWAEEVDLGDANWEPGQRTINGLAYRVATLKKQVLIPLRSGRLRIDPMTLNYRVNPASSAVERP